jgi:hypothetical protein
MYTEIIVLLMLLGYGILYMFMFYRVQQVYFKKFNLSDANPAVITLFLSSLVSASVNLVHISDIAADALRFFIGAGFFQKGLMYCLFFFAGMWIFSFLLFQVSFVIIGMMTKENETDELIKNNLFLALVHSVILLSLSFIISPALVKLAAGLIPYPKMPF